ncbi:ricin-type beta-trefoil lectin domain protein [Streptomyces sp. NPDC057623]|uniref:RICIN domain-containing protein n=1 Tax=Streptomyces sp. NPDC057623 TaxID=3346187 RepID=UPI00367641B3
MKKVAAVGAAVVLGWALGTAPANASSSYWHLQNAATGHCLDYRADYGPYATGCNEGAYQTWLMNDAIGELSALRQKAGDRLCLVARNGQATMKPCSSSDPAALWDVHATAAGLQLINNVTKTCLGEGSGSIAHVTLVRCTGGDSQQWNAYS